MNRTIQFFDPPTTRSNEFSFVAPDSPPGSRAVTLDLPEGKRRFELEFSACTNPTCMCRELKVYLRPSGGPADSKVGLTVSFDDDRISIQNHPRDQAVAEAFVGRVSNDDFLLLLRELFKLKADSSELSDDSEINSEFPEDILADPGCLLAYKEAFPWSADLEFISSGVSWIALELYCTNPDCMCASVLVEFIPKPATTNAPPKRNPTGDTTLIYFDYQAGTQRLERMGRKALAAPDELIDALRAVCPNWKSRFERRHRILTGWHRRAREPRPVVLTRSPQAVQSRKVGRKEPCPCGSGKKYKHCCGP